ncbi:hypothetical protein [Spartinivicinus poritis]|uniref:Baseplate protein J-like domain-containing protein n=1 Tax=Spartinivicinus poritis TaxID=2994640 RepID=A0ABT5UFR8_9GAMM|nr:hypothetical protein [Spartinivicinus sp. A2-2]MDE1465030.1 hypothetical protein [Spartinivicinus sp. A2-2]
MANEKSLINLDDQLGTLQKKRSLPAFAPSHFSIEERDTNRWLEYLYHFAQHIHFFDLKHGDQGHRWHSALPSPPATPNDISDIQTLLHWVEGNQLVPPRIKRLASRPDIALLMAFFQLLQHPQKQFNELTSRHQSYYFNDLLKIHKQPPVPDSCFIVATLAADATTTTLPQGTLFNAGDDSEGQPLQYELLADTTLNQARVSHVKNLLKLDDGPDSLIAVSTLFDEPTELSIPPTGVMTFGDLANTDEIAPAFPNIGLFITSSYLWLTEGVRTIRLTFDARFIATLQEADLMPDQLSHYFDIHLSTAEGVILLSDSAQALVEDTAAGTVQITLTKLFPPVTTLPDLRPHPSVETPFLQLTLKKVDEEIIINNDNDTQLVSKQQRLNQLKSVSFNTITLEVMAKGLTQLVLRHDSSELSPDQPFEPFSSQPFSGSQFTFTHPELVMKDLSSLTLHFDWVNKPDSFSDYYAAYQTYLNDNNWPHHQVTITAFTNDASSTYPLFNSDSLHINNTTLLARLQRFQQADFPLTDTDPFAWPNRLTLTLTGDDFGHTLFPKVIERFSLQNAQLISTGGDLNKIIHVSQPYTPTTKSLAIDYSAKVNINVPTAGAGTEHQLIHQHPIGQQHVVDTLPPTDFYFLLPKISQNGYLYIGLNQAPIPGVISLFFHIEPIDQVNQNEVTEVQWSYLDNNHWRAFITDKQFINSFRGTILADSTDGLLHSGIIQFRLPEITIHQEALSNNQQVWLRAAVHSTKGHLAPQLSRLHLIQAQAFMVNFVDNNNSPSHLEIPLPAGSITELVQDNPAINTISQPIESVNGKPVESTNAYQIRVSEQLRHKGRALTTWDYEHLVLDKFPFLFLVKCLRLCTADNRREPFAINVVVIPKFHHILVLQPKVPLFIRKQIKYYLQTIAPPAARISVNPPRFQEVQIEVSVNFISDTGVGLFIEQLNDALVLFLSPWSNTDDSQSNAFENTLYLTDIMSFIESQPYVIKVFNIKVLTRLSTEKEWTLTTLQVVRGLSPDVILVPARKHNIRSFSEAPLNTEGIGVMEVEFDFILE